MKTSHLNNIMLKTRLYFNYVDSMQVTIHDFI
jgi:hypothetical protein